MLTCIHSLLQCHLRVLKAGIQSYIFGGRSNKNLPYFKKQFEKKTAHTLKITFNLGFEETLQEGFKKLKFSIINFFFYFKLQILQTTRETSNILNPWQIHYDSFYLQSNQWDKAMVFDFFSIWTNIRNSIFQTGQLLAHCTVFWNVDFFWSFVDLTFQFGDNVAGDVSELGLVPGAPWWTPVAVWGPQWG